LIKNKTMKLFILILLIFCASCSPRIYERAYICKNVYKTYPGYVHQFASFTNKWGYDCILDSSICGVGDTILIKFNGEITYFAK
jgi:hypothetical protein